MKSSGPPSSSRLSVRPRGEEALFSEKAFYLEEFYGRTLLFGLIPPVGQRTSDLKPLVQTLRELRRNQTRCVVIAASCFVDRIRGRMGSMARAAKPPAFRAGRGSRSRPYPDDAAVAEIWERSRTGLPVIASLDADDPVRLTTFSQQLASRLRVFKLILLDYDGGVVGPGNRRLSFAESGRINRLARNAAGPARRAILRACARALKDGVRSVNLAAPDGVYQELFSFLGAGTLFTPAQYGRVRPISIDDFEEVEALIRRGEHEGFLLPRTPKQVAMLLPSCFGYRIGDEHLAGVCSLLTEPYRRERAGEITALYTLTRFQGEGVAAALVRAIVREARVRRLSCLFACTSQPRAERFFLRLGFHRAGPEDVPAAKWRGYDPDRMNHLSVLRLPICTSEQR